MTKKKVEKKVVKFLPKLKSKIHKKKTHTFHRKRTIRHRTSHTKRTPSTKIKTTATEKTLIENFVIMQKVMVEQSIKIEKLTAQLSKLLELFETSAKALAEKDFSTTKSPKEEKEIITKLDTLANQNKIIAKGLTLLHEGRARPEEQMQNPMEIPKPTPPAQQPPQNVQEQNLNMQGYQKSILSSSRDAPARAPTRNAPRI